MVKKIDSKLLKLISTENQRQANNINFIASENYVSDYVRQVSSSVLTNKYAEGYPGKRYYAGCSIIDKVEMLAIERCKKLFGASHINVQPHAGSQANMAAYHALLNPGDTVLGMSLDSGGHLTHGHKVNFSGSLYKIIQYTVHKETELIDYNEIERLAHKHKPSLIIAGASSYSRIIDFKRFHKIARSINAYLLADIAHIAGLIAARIHPTPVGLADIISSTTHKTLRGPRGGLLMCSAKYAEKIDRAIMPGTQGGPFMHNIAAKAAAFHEALQPEFIEYQKQVVLNAQVMANSFIEKGYRVVSGGTDNHMFVVDLRSKNITGLQAERLLENIDITVSRSCIPFDSAKPWITSGIRIGTPAMTTRGMKEKEAIEIVDLIDTIIRHRDCKQTNKKVKYKMEQIVLDLTLPYSSEEIFI